MIDLIFMQSVRMHSARHVMPASGRRLADAWRAEARERDDERFTRYIEILIERHLGGGLL